MRDNHVIQRAVFMPLLIAVGMPIANAQRGPLAHSTKIEPPACAVWIDNPIIIGKDRVEAVVNYSEPIGERLTATFADSAKIDVISVRRETSDTPMTATLVANTKRGVEGEWLLTLRGNAGTCTGKVWVHKPKSGG